MSLLVARVDGVEFGRFRKIEIFDGVCMATARARAEPHLSTWRYGID